MAHVSKTSRVTSYSIRNEHEPLLQELLAETGAVSVGELVAALVMHKDALVPVLKPMVLETVLALRELRAQEIRDGGKKGGALKAANAAARDAQEAEATSRRQAIEDAAAAE